jgi:hypothetical protein
LRRERPEKKMRASWIMVWGALCALAVACGGSSSQDGAGGSSGSSGGSAGSTSSGCPLSFEAAEGQPCSPEGKICGGENCPECGFCNMLECSSGKWWRLEAFPGDCSDGGVQLCGGFVGDMCAADEFCDFDYAGKNWCGGDDSTGVCTKRPDVCGADCPGVCGCDGKAYCNACTAHAAGVDDTDDTSCLPDGGVVVCGTSANIPCGAGEFCDFADGCGSSPGAAGICVPKPQGCTADCPGVCGCDGNFYCNVDTSDSKSCFDGGA